MPSPGDPGQHPVRTVIRPWATRPAARRSVRAILAASPEPKPPPKDQAAAVLDWFLFLHRHPPAPEKAPAVGGPPYRAGAFPTALVWRSSPFQGPGLEKWALT